MKTIIFVFIVLFSFQSVIAQPTQCFTAIHCDPTEPENFPFLEQLVDSANSYNIKLTIEFTGPWVDSIFPYPYRKNKIALWYGQGHEIAMHHHDITHQMQWDGYTNHTMAEVYAAGKDTNDYKGDMEFLYNRILSIIGTAPLKTIGNSDSVDLPLNCIFQTQGIFIPEAYSNPVTYNYEGINYCSVGYAYLSSLLVEDSLETIYPLMTSFSSLGVVFHVNNYVSNSWPIRKWFNFINQQGLQSKTVAQLLISFSCPPLADINEGKSNWHSIVIPNPSSDMIDITFKNPDNSEFSMVVYDELNRIVIGKNNFKEQKVTIDISSLKPGIYFYKIFNSEKYGYGKFVVK